MAITNTYPAILSFLTKKRDGSHVSLRVCGSSAVLGTVFIIAILTTTGENISPLLWLFGHVFLNFLYYLYLNKLNFDLSNTTQIYYRNFFSIIFLLPISFYLDVLHVPTNRGWEFYVGCFVSGVFGTLLQVWTFKVSQKSNFLKIDTLAKLLCSLIACKLFHTNIQYSIWAVIVVNFLISGIFLKITEKCPSNIKSQIYLALPPQNVNVVEIDMVPPV